MAEAYERASRDASAAFADIVKAQEDGAIEPFRDAKARNDRHTKEVREAANELGLDDCAPS